MKAPAQVLLCLAISILLPHCKPDSKPQISPEPPELSFEEKLSGSWNYLRVASGVDDGCTGLALQQEFTILRKESGIEISGKQTLRNGTVIEKDSRALNGSEFEKLISDLLLHYQIATIEKNIKEYFDAMPEAERKEKLERYFQVNPQPYGGFDGSYLYLLFDPENPHSALTDGFENPRSFAACSDWIRDTP